MKRIFFFLSLFCAFLSAWADESVPAFPGAEGHARYTTTGGRGGTVYHVTTLADSGTGSLRWALSQATPAIIVFDVSGYIDLASDLNITKSHVTIAGQTAPEGGITLRYYTVQVKADDVIVRYLRFRRSQVKDVNDGADASWGRQHKNIIFDHCTFSWSIDELASFYDNASFTMQWCILAEALANPGHSKGEHSYGGIWGGKGASFHHNLLLHMQNRVPRFNGARYNYTGNLDTQLYPNTLQAERVDFRNCVLYNWGTGGCYGGPGGGYINIVNNYYKAGPGTKNRTRVTQVTVGSSGNASGYPIYWGYASRYCISGNYVTAAGASSENYDWAGVVYDSGLSTIDGARYIPDAAHYYGDTVHYVKNADGVDCVSLRLDAPTPAGDVTTHSASEAYDKVVTYAGASLYRDAADQRYAEETRTTTCTYTGTITQRAGIVDLINDPDGTLNEALPSYPTLPNNARADDFDTDGDGMPDAWEQANGLDPEDDTDGNRYTLDTARQWYTNVEVYLNSLVEPITRAENEEAVTTVDEYYPQCSSSALTTLTPAACSAHYYDLMGHCLPAAPERPGIYIRALKTADGLTAVDKVMR